MNVNIRVLQEDIDNFGFGGAYALSVLRDVEKETGSDMGGAHISYDALAERTNNIYTARGLRSVIDRLKEAGKITTKVKKNSIGIVNVVFTIME